ncbi:CGNR zinc finger domain-containing protein [Nonomuraea sp. NPDC048916]|uniref:CGNR zinc finger domain-containing protein n=1 Tax=Nonomuraea sp. NPDC048916 TaxID=3154232 RepID=UPI0033D91D56
MEFATLLVNTLAVDRAHGRPAPPPPDAAGRLAALLHALDTARDSAPDHGDQRSPGTIAGPGAGVVAGSGVGTAAERPLTAVDADRLTGVASELRPLFAGDPRAIARLNELLVRHGAVPSLYGDPPRLAFHRPQADSVDAWAADTGTALAMVIGVGQGVRLRSCQAEGCDLVFFDVTRNASRRFCGLSCQNRAKASAYRARRRT